METTLQDRPVFYTCAACDMKFTAKALAIHRKACTLQVQTNKIASERSDESQKSHDGSVQNLDHQKNENSLISEVSKTLDALVCKICDIVFTNNEEAKSHTLFKHTSESFVPFYTSDSNESFGCSTSTKEEMFENKKLVLNLNGQELEIVTNGNTSIAKSPESELKCMVCSIMMTKDLMDGHVKSHVFTYHDCCYICSECSMKFQTETKVLLHFKIHLHNSYLCDLCSHSFALPEELKAHYQQVHSLDCKRLYCCYICQMRFDSAYSVFNHMKIHTGKIQNHCQNNQEKLFQSLNSPKADHHIRQLNCEFENVIKLEPGEVVQSMDTDNIEDSWQTCSICGHHFEKMDDFKLHLRKHLNERQFVCKECGKGFGHESTLRNHMRIHTGEKPFCCNVCGRRFTQICNLKRHMARHAIQQNLHCEVCKKVFHSSKDILNHECQAIADNGKLKSDLKSLCPNKSEDSKFLLITDWPAFLKQKKLTSSLKKADSEPDHSYSFGTNEEGPKEGTSGALESSCNETSENGAVKRKWRIFPCPVCGKVYTWLYDLKIHFRSHSGEKPFACNICGRKFAQSGAVRIHILKYHQKEN